jgi:signal transduction histidine kinase
VTDNTERKIMENKLRRANEELEKKVVERTLELTGALEREKSLNEMKSRFVSMASHEFRTPLSAIMSSISLIDSYRSSEDIEKRTKHVERIKSSVRNLTDILNNFLSIDKLEQGKIEVEHIRFDLSEFIVDIIEEMRGMLEKKQQYISYQRNGEIEVVMDKKIMRNILLNLLSNACKYSPENNPIDIEVRRQNQRIVISVKDYGIGIPEEEQSNMFRNFFRAKNAVNIQGTGLGLNIVKRYVEIINGTIHFESQVGKGTTFTIEIPATI